MFNVQLTVIINIMELGFTRPKEKPKALEFGDQDSKSDWLGWYYRDFGTLSPTRGHEICYGIFYGQGVRWHCAGFQDESVEIKFYFHSGPAAAGVLGNPNNWVWKDQLRIFNVYIKYKVLWLRLLPPWFHALRGSQDIDVCFELMAFCFSESKVFRNERVILMDETSISWEIRSLFFKPCGYSTGTWNNTEILWFGFGWV